jgi:hypothetical protein
MISRTVPERVSFGTKKTANEIKGCAVPKAKQQIEGYLDTATGADHAVECQKWAGILWDGASLAFCHSDGHKWAPLFDGHRWTRPR